MNRNIWVYLLLTIITCGFFGIYWIVVLNDDASNLSKEFGPSGVGVIGLSIITCGIYMYFWNYKTALKIRQAQNLYGKTETQSLEILCLILAICGFSIVSIMIMQDAVNKIVE